jgi:hypothetical protein
VTEKTPKSFSLKTLKNYAHRIFRVSKIIQSMETIREKFHAFSVKSWHFLKMDKNKCPFFKTPGLLQIFISVFRPY